MYWRNMQDGFDTPVKLAGLLDDIPVTIIVIDDRLPSDFHRPYQESSKRLTEKELSDFSWLCQPELLGDRTPHFEVGSWMLLHDSRAARPRAPDPGGAVPCSESVSQNRQLREFRATCSLFSYGLGDTSPWELRDRSYSNRSLGRHSNSGKSGSLPGLRVEL